MSKNDFWERSHTAVRFPRAPFTLSRDNKVALWGSCFAKELGKYYKEYKLPYSVSPFGIIYNPVVAADSMNMLHTGTLRGKPFYHLNLWRHDAFHSSQCYKGFENDNRGVKVHFENQIKKGQNDLHDSDLLILTLGTAYLYQYKETGIIVNNCHKQHNNKFNRLPFTQFTYSVADELHKIFSEIKRKRPSLNIVLSVSPIRHLRDDARENSYSKALLRCLCEDLSIKESYIHYFPAYEIVMDELRDYRWYTGDLSHINEEAISYIMDRFFQWCGNSELLEYIEKQKKELKHNGHRS